MKTSFHSSVLFLRQRLDFADAKPQNCNRKRTMFRRFLVTGTAIVILATAVIPANAAAERFKDVPAKSWYYTAVDHAVSTGLFSGTSADTFSPGTPMTRGMFVRVLGNKAKIDPKQYPTSSFSDVNPGTWYGPYVEWAAENKIISGIGGGRFAPNQSVTREQMAVILYNYAKYADCDLTTRAGTLERFSDGSRVSTYAKRAMEWAITHKLLSGSGGRMDPQGTATRAQVAQIFYNSRNLLADTESENPIPPSPSPSPDPNTPHTSITDEVRKKLQPNQDPEMILDYVINGHQDDPSLAFDGTTAEWDPSLVTSADSGWQAMASWENEESDSRSSTAIANAIQQLLTRTASDRFCITAEEEDGCFALYYHPADKPDSQKMRQIKAALNLPGSKQYDRSIAYEATGWAGPMEWEWYGSAEGIAEKIEYYLLGLHPYTTHYYLTEPQPGVFYLLYASKD